MDKSIKAKTSKQNYALLAIGLICVLIAFLLTYRMVHQARRRPFPMPRETKIELLQSWMTVGHISRIYAVPEAEFVQKLNLDPKTSHNMTLEKIAKQEEKDVKMVISEVGEIIKAFQLLHETPPPINR